MGLNSTLCLQFLLVLKHMLIVHSTFTSLQAPAFEPDCMQHMCFAACTSISSLVHAPAPAPDCMQDTNLTAGSVDALLHEYCMDWHLDLATCSIYALLQASFRPHSLPISSLAACSQA